MSSIKLKGLISEFEQMYEHYNGLAGLTPEETKALRALLEIRRDFKNTHKKGEYNGPAFRKFIANERKIVELNKSMQWWQSNIETLRKLEIWENLNTIIVNKVRNEGLPASELRRRQHLLTDIKYEWTRQQLFAAYSSQNLMEFYNNYILVMEKTLADTTMDDEMKSRYYKVREMRKQAIYSMIARLETIEDDRDIECDDILQHIIRRIEKECDIKISHEEKQPAKRHGMTPELINGYIAAIDNYLKDYPNEKIVFSYIDKHSAVIKPYHWSTYNEKTLSTSALNRIPAITFIANQLPNLIAELDLKRNIHEEILSTEASNDANFILRRIDSMLTIAETILQKNTNLDKNDLDRRINEDINQLRKKFNKQLEEIYLRISIEIKNMINYSIDNVFSNDMTNYENIIKLTDYLLRAEEFDRNFLTSEYDPDKDIILAISARFKQIIERNGTITEDMVMKACKLLMIATDSEVQSTELKSHLVKLPKLIRDIHANDDHYIMHYIAHQIEANLMTGENILTALKRHAYIAELYGKPWNDVAKNNKQGLQQYISDVFIPLIQQSPTITLDNFNHDNHTENISYAIDDASGVKNKLQLETEVMKKINKLFEIKNYIHTSSEKNIDIEKLKNLITRVDAYFSEDENKKQIYQTIRNACVDLTKNYIISSIQHDRTPDFDYLDKINSLIKSNVLSELASDNDITQLLITYEELYNGATNTLGRLFVEFSKVNLHFNSENMYYHYATKRLDYISSSNCVTPCDYYFFYHFMRQRDIGLLFKKYKNRYESIISNWLDHTSEWQPQRAMLIELFGNESDVDKYRFKRLRELINLGVANDIDVVKSNHITEEFSSTINIARSLKYKLVNPGNILINTTNLSTYLDYAANSKPWSPTLEYIVSKAGTDDQLRLLHYRFITKQINTCTDFRETPIGKLLSTASTMNDYLLLLGEANIPKLCAQIERALTSLNAASHYTNQNPLAEKDYQLYMSLLQSLKPLQSFYFTFATNNIYKDMIHDLPDIEKKLQLHQAIHATIKKEAYLLSIASENTSLHNHILTLTKNVMALEDGHYLTSENTSQYLQFATTEILDKANEVIENKKYDLSIPVLSTFLGLLSHLPSDHLKLQLTIAHKNDALQYPVWLMLINHMDEKHVISSVISYLSHQPTSYYPNNGFNELFSFSKKLTILKSSIHQLILHKLFIAAGISDTRLLAADHHGLAQWKTLTDKQLFTLWRTTIMNIQIDNAGMKYLTSLACQLGGELIDRARHNPELLGKFMSSFQLLSAQFKVEKPTPPHFSIWASPSPSEIAFMPFIKIAQRGIAMLMIQKLDDFIIHLSSPQSFELYCKVCNDPVYVDKFKTPDMLATSIKDELHLKSNRVAYIVAHTMPLYHAAQKTLSGNNPAQNIGNLVAELTQAAVSNPILAQSREFKFLIDDLSKLSTHNPIVQNDQEFEEKSVWKRMFSLSG